MLIDHTCGCGETYAVPDSQVGRAVRCPYCFGMSPVARPARRPMFEPSRARAVFALLFLVVPLGGAVAVWLGADRLPREPLPGSELAVARVLADEAERAEVDRPASPAAAPLEFVAPLPAPVPAVNPAPVREAVAAQPVDPELPVLNRWFVEIARRSGPVGPQFDPARRIPWQASHGPGP